MMSTKFGEFFAKEEYKCITPGCTNTIVFAAVDEVFYRKMGWVNQDGTVRKPRRCKECRDSRKKLKGAK